MTTLIAGARGRVPRFAEAAVERARLTVVPRRASKAPKIPFVTLVSLLLITGVVGLLLFNTSMQQASFTATSLEQRVGILDAKEQSLQLELEMMRDPQKVAARAKRIGMVPGTGPAFIRLSDGKVLGNPKIAEPGAGMRIAPPPTPKPKSLRPDPIIVKILAEKMPRKPQAPTAALSAADTAAGATVAGLEAGTNRQQQQRGGGQGGQR